MKVRQEMCLKEVVGIGNLSFKQRMMKCGEEAKEKKRILGATGWG